MIKKISIGITILVVLSLAWYLLSPLWKMKEANKPSPLQTLSALSPDMREQFDTAMEEANRTVLGVMDTMPANPHVLAKGNFIGDVHDVGGTALLIESGGTHILRLENFETLNGPDLHIYLARAEKNDDIVDLGKIKATKGNVNYAITKEVNFQEYHRVLVFCVPFKVLFGHADLH